jgi:hypothetical protein
MVTMSLKDVNQSFGPLFAEKFRVMVDNRAGIAETIELSRSHIDQTPWGAKTLGIESCIIM